MLYPMQLFTPVLELTLGKYLREANSILECPIRVYHLLLLYRYGAETSTTKGNGWSIIEMIHCQCLKTDILNLQSSTSH